MTLFCFQICFFAASLQLLSAIGDIPTYSHLNWGLGNCACWKFGSGWWCYCLSFSLFYFLLIVSLLGWGNTLNKPGQLHNHHVILLETEEHLLFSGYVYTKHVLIRISGVVQFQITIHYSSMVAVTTSKLTTGRHRQPLFFPPKGCHSWYVETMIFLGASPQSYLCSVKTPYSVPPSVTSRSWSWTGGGDGTQGNMQLLVAVAMNWCRISAIKVDSPLFSQRGNL